jgi:hypothetical protein
MKKAFALTSVFLLCAFFAGAAWAQGKTIPPHVHGEGTFNVAIEGTGIDIDYDGPLANFISFEHKPSTPEQVAEMRDMMTKLNDPAKLFGFPAAWGCVPNPVKVEGSNIPEEILGHEHAAEGEGHGHVHGDEEGHDHDHGDEEGHDHGEHGEHSDVEVEFSFSCPKIAAGSGQIDFKGLFAAFPNLHDADVNMVRPDGQSGFELTPNQSLAKW